MNKEGGTDLRKFSITCSFSSCCGWGLTNLETISSRIPDERNARSVVLDVAVEDGLESIDACEFGWTGVCTFELERVEVGWGAEEGRRRLFKRNEAFLRTFISGSIAYLPQEGEREGR